MGRRVHVPCLASLDSAGLSALLAEVWRHGVVCIPNQSLDASQLVGLSTRIGEPLVLPKCFFDGFREPGFPQVCRALPLRS